MLYYAQLNLINGNPEYHQFGIFVSIFFPEIIKKKKKCVSFNISTTIF